MHSARWLVTVIAVFAIMGSSFACQKKSEEVPIKIQKSGLSIQDKKVGDGPEAVPGKTLTINYTGWFWENEQKKKFDSSYDRGKPFTFVLGEGQVVKGWDEGLKGMKVGGKRWMVMPPEYGYGEKGMGDVIPPNTILEFEVDLIQVK